MIYIVNVESTNDLPREAFLGSQEEADSLIADLKDSSVVTKIHQYTAESMEKVSEARMKYFGWG